jgi:flagellum-specific ATP synthase
MSGAGLGRYLSAMPARAPLACHGRVIEVTGLAVRALLDGVRQGELVEIGPGEPKLPAEVVAFRGGEAVLLPLGPTRGLSPGAEVAPTGRTLAMLVGPACSGGCWMDWAGPLTGDRCPAGSRRGPSSALLPAPSSGAG